MLEFRTQGYNGYAVKWSPFGGSRIAVTASANFGLVGNGRLFTLRLTSNGIQAEQVFDTNDALYDLAWSEVNENQLVAACGDGTIKMYDTSVDTFPVQTFSEHNREVYGISWNMVTKDRFASSSWDGTIKIWTPGRPHSLMTLPTHSCTYSTAFSPHNAAILSSVTTDSHLRVFDLRTPASASNHLVALIPIHGPPPQLGNPNANRHTFPPAECLTHDWNKYRSEMIATAGVDKMVRTFDIRMPRQGPVSVLHGHRFAIRRLAWSPHMSDVLLTGSYDMTCRIWSAGGGYSNPNMPALNRPAGEVACMDRHSEFVTGVDWCLFGSDGWCASTAWDERLLVWDARSLVRN